MVLFLAAWVLQNPTLPVPQTRLDPRWDYDGRRILGAIGKEAFLWDARTGRIVQRLAGHGDWVSSVLFLRDGKHALTGAGSEGETHLRSDDTAIRLWDLATGREVRRFEGLKNHAESVQVSGDGRRLVAVSSGDSHGLVWDMATGKRLFTFEDVHSGVVPPSVPPAAFSPDGRTLLALNTFNVRVLDSADGHEIARIADPVRRAQFQTAVFSPDGRWIATAENGSGTKDGECPHSASLWDARTGASVRRFEMTDWPLGALFAQGGRLVTVDHHSIRTWDAASGQALRSETLSGPFALGYASGFMLDAAGRRVLVDVAHADGILWDLASGRALARLAGNPESTAGFVALAPDGRTFLAWATSGDRDALSATVRSADDGRVVRGIVLEGSGRS